MSFAPGTILAKKVTADNAYDRLRVVGPSPIRTATATGEWTGSGGGDLYICEPIGDGEFHATEIVPSGALYGQYRIESEPPLQPTHIESARPGVPVRQLSPEEQFRLAASQAEVGVVEKPKRQRTRIGNSE